MSREATQEALVEALRAYIAAPGLHERTEQPRSHPAYDSEIDDSRPTVIRRCSDNPRFISVLSGKINTVYELDGELI